MTFKKGESGNLKGRPRERFTPEDLRLLKRGFTRTSYAMIKTIGDDLIDKVVQMALEGNERMITLLWNHFHDKGLLNKLETKLKSDTASEIDASQGIVIQKMADGEIESDHGESLVKVLAIKRDTSIVKELEEKVNKIMKG